MADKPNQAQANYEAYRAGHKERLEREHPGATALMHEGDVIGVYDSEDEAYDDGCKRYGLGDFSLVRIGQQPHRRGRRIRAVSA